MPTRFVACAVCCAVVAPAAVAQTYRFEIEPGPSGLNGRLEADTSGGGELRGDWNPLFNGDGTRTKAGLSGEFGRTENEPVACSLGLSLGGELETHAAGGFVIVLDERRERLTLSGLSIDLAWGERPGVGVLGVVETGGFRTRAPESVFDTDEALLARGAGELRALTLTQSGDGAAGELERIERDRYRFSVTLGAGLAAGFGVGDAEIAPPRVEVPLTLSGEISREPDGSLWLGSVDVIEVSEGSAAVWETPEIAAAIETIDPPGGSAGVLLGAEARGVELSLVAELRLSATGWAECRADFDGSGEVDVLDVLAFLNAWGAGEAEADFNGDGRVDSADVLAFLHAWASGCPR